ncbi:hypothetical protein PW52_06285 [Tamlana sedimentorum]|uniref:Secretion system C-terminal sorting domain-containing protein n=1 Tax=Neotamlana sedimentorum TaxID=1435349 RepID=A0A0D7WAK3_9FLAO|nr:T9SS type A sorting domain-containing protein [Tamlana sedimentorum]KJD36205.1 hypothetical protein PW52_06285 [Tamlana sedimentorum]
MKKTLLSIFTFTLALISYSQNDILLITDNDFNTDHNTSIHNAILATSYTNVTVHDAVANGVPNLTTLSNYDLIIWFTGDDGVGLSFWNNGTAGIEDLRTYLDNGGYLWLIGTDLIYNMYGSAPADFASGQFLYDYAKIESYDMQSYIDDSNAGVAQLDRSSTANTSYPTPISWIYSTIWYIDAVTPAAGVESIYEFGPEIYPHSGETTMTNYKGSTYRVMASFFNPSNFDSTDNKINTFFGAALDQLFETELSTNSFDNKPQLEVYPNPSTDSFKISITNQSLINKPYSVYNMLGKEVLNGTLNSLTTEISTKFLSRGNYFLKIDSETKKLVKI